MHTGIPAARLSHWFMDARWDSWEFQHNLRISNVIWRLVSIWPIQQRALHRAGCGGLSRLCPQSYPQWVWIPTGPASGRPRLRRPGGTGRYAPQITACRRRRGSRLPPRGRGTALPTWQEESVIPLHSWPHEPKIFWRYCGFGCRKPLAVSNWQLAQEELATLASCNRSVPLLVSPLPQRERGQKGRGTERLPRAGSIETGRARSALIAANR
jgi:hypothetical protein